MLGKIEGRRRRGWNRIRWLYSITDSMGMSLSKLWQMVKGIDWHATVHEVTKSQTHGNWWLRSLRLKSKESICNAVVPGSIPMLGRSPGEGNSSPLQYCCRENSMDSGAWHVTVHGFAKLDMTK